MMIQTSHENENHTERKLVPAKWFSGHQLFVI